MKSEVTLCKLWAKYKNRPLKWWASTPLYAVRILQRKFHKNPNVFLRNAKGVIHIGANDGEEKELYATYNLDVIWIEPIFDVTSLPIWLN